MLSIRHSDGETLRKVLASEGGFAWWYVDLVDERGDGAVLIWFFGLPFLPGARQHPSPAARPGINLVTYEGGRPSGYVLQQLAPEDVDWTPGSLTWRFADSLFRAEVDDGRVRLDASLDLVLPAPGGRWQGALHVEGPRCRFDGGGAGDDPSGEHGWSPFTCFAHGSLELQAPGRAPFSLAGRAYFDTNASQRPLHGLGIADWRWGRYAFDDHEFIYYLVWPEKEDAPDIQLLLRVEPNGTVIPHAQPRCEIVRPRRNFYGLTYPRALRLTSADGLDVTVRHRHVVDEGPFYLRFISEAEDVATGRTALGVAERVVPQRVDRPWQRPFVKMRRHAIGGANSMWLPLFSGPREQRWSRLVRAWSGSQRRGGHTAMEDGR